MIFILCVEPKVEAIDRKVGEAIKEFKDVVFPDDYNPGGKPAPKRKVAIVWLVLYAVYTVWPKNVTQ